MQKYQSTSDSSSHVFSGASLDEAAPLILRHHYSQRLPANIQHIYAVREPGGLFGDTGTPEAVAVFSIPPTRWAEDILELSRLVRKPSYSGQLSGLIAFSCNALRRAGHTLLVSFADNTQNHHGGIYQASSWRYHAKRESGNDGLIVDGIFVPGRSCNSRWGTRSAEKLSELLPNADIQPHFDEGKYLYWRALNRHGKAVAKRLELQSNPYPKPQEATEPD